MNNMFKDWDRSRMFMFPSISVASSEMPLLVRKDLMCFLASSREKVAIFRTSRESYA